MVVESCLLAIQRLSVSILIKIYWLLYVEIIKEAGIVKKIKMNKFNEEEGKK